MSLLVSLADARDLVVIVYGIVGIAFFFVGLIMLIILGFTVKGLLKNVNGILNDSVKPTVESVKEAADTFRGTTEFVGRTAIAPIVRTYGAFAGLREGLGVLTSLKRRGRAK